MKKLLLILSIGLLLLSACKEDAVTEPAEYEITISGKVVDKAEVPLGFCDVTLLNAEETYNTSSDEEGFFTFSIVVTELDSFRLNVQKEYYQTQSLLYSALSEEEMKDIKIILPKTFVTISGALTELDENGLHSSVGTKVSVHLQNVSFDTLQTETDENGDFSFLLDPLRYNKFAFEEIRILVAKQDFITIDTLIVNANQNSLTDVSLQITKLCNYFPLKVGNKWEYEVIRSGGDGYIYFEDNGKEIWEITYISSNNIYFNLDVYFTGRDIVWSNWHSDKDTVYMTNEKTSYELKFEEGYIKPQHENGRVPWSKSMKSDILFQHPASNDGLYTYNKGGESRISLTYTLFISRGLEYYRDRYSDGSSYSDKKITLLNFTEGG